MGLSEVLWYAVFGEVGDWVWVVLIFWYGLVR